MALQDLTPQLRTRMTRVERLVGLFILLAALLMLVAFGYYLMETGRQRGWFINKVSYYCYTRDATGLKVGDPVRLLGRDIGRIVEIQTTAPDEWFITNNFNVFIRFEVWEPYFGYIWTDSTVRVEAADFFGSRYLEVTRGESYDAMATVVENPNDFRESLVASGRDPDHKDRVEMVRLADVPKGIWLETVETPALADRAQEIVAGIANALPSLTNQIGQMLTQAGTLTSNANAAITRLQPTLEHIEGLAARLESEDGVIGRMVLTTNLQTQVSSMLANMDETLTNTTVLLRTGEQQLQELTRRIAVTLDHVAMVTSNLSHQVSANSMILTEISGLVVSAEDLLEGLKRHWLLRSAFDQPRTNAPIESVVRPSLDLPRR